MEIDKKAFRRVFPNLAREMEEGACKITISSVRLDPEEGEKAASRRFDGYNPDVIDFIRRCDTEEQAEEIIAYLEKRGEISQSYALSLREQLMKKGVRSFGPKKEEAYYLRQSGYG
ncbi:MAG: DUF2095 family protein [Candidatus Bathyarchaeia archaeon]